MIKAALILRIHEQPTLAYKNTCQVHGAIAMHGLTSGIDTRRRTVHFEAVDLQLIGRVLIPARFGPQRLAMAGIAFRFPAESSSPRFAASGPVPGRGCTEGRAS
jgi:hypothetical protein